MKTYIKYDLEGNFLESFEVESVKELSKLLGCDINTLYDHLNNRNVSCNNLQIKQLTSDRLIKKIGSVYSITTGKQANPIIKRYNGKLISCYTDINEASIKNNIPVNLINGSIENNGKTGGFNFEFIK